MSNSLTRGNAKILVLGDSGVGKSSLIHLICHSSVLNSPQWTIGCSIEVKLHENYFLEFWDVGGSRSHKIARSLLYQNYHGIILAFDATNNKSRSNLNEWLVEATQKIDDEAALTCVKINVPIITIATKRDLLPYGSIIDRGDSSTSFDSEHCSVINFHESSHSNYRQRRNLSSSSSNSRSSLISQVNQPFSTHSSNSRSDIYDTQVGNQVIYVNTQDCQSFSPGSKNCEKLDHFFKQVIDRRNKIF